MSDEEKKAIDDLFALTHINGYIDLYTQREVKIHTLDLSKWQNGVKVLLKLIEKQSKEIEELKRKEQLIKTYKGNLPENVEFICLCKNDFERNISDYYISKDKIKAKIEELEIEQESNREDLKIAIDNLLFQNIDKIGNRISINMSVREILQSLLEKE